MASRLLAEEFVRQGHEVAVVTGSAGEGENLWPFAVVRRPRLLELLQLVRRSDVYFQNHISLRRAWPLLFVRRPWVVALHTWVPRLGIAGRLQHFSLRYARCIANSNPIAAHVRARSVVIPGPYDDHVFREMPGVPRDGHLLFVGRLIRDKGVHLLLEAIARLRMEGLEPSLTIVGRGPEKDALARQVKDLRLAAQVEFAGVKAGNELALLLNRHRILVVPSLWQEPFGIVALEGIACGCVLVGSDRGGLKEAIGPCGITFPNGDSAALAVCLTHLLSSPEGWEQYREGAASHLRPFTRAAVARSYLQVLQAAYDQSNRRAS